jgi:LPXTG-motif cell wall-anchored protein
MRNRHLHAQLRRSAATVGVAAAAVMASAFTLAPAALADDVVDDPGTTTEPTDPPAEDPPPVDTPPVDTPTPPDATGDPTSTDQPTDPSEAPAPAGPAAKTAPTAATPKAEVEAVVPDYGSNKVRIGVRVKDGSYVPDGTSTMGTKITITETGPADPKTTTCTTTLGTDDAADPTATFCLFEYDVPERSVATPSATQSFPAYSVAPGDSVTITQQTVRPNLVISQEVFEVGPCVVTPFPGLPDCPSLQDSERLVLNDPGLPPEAADDDTCVDPGVPVSIDVLANDDTVNGAPLTDLEVTSDPAKGNAAVTGNGDARKIRFSPNANFSGSTSFDYQITTPNGTASATVEVERCPEPTGVLPDTGGGDPRLLAYGGLLIAGGGGLIISGRRRRQHAFVD